MTAIYERPAELLQTLIRFNTTNPPGNEAECIAYLQNLLHEAGIETQLFEKVPGRPNLIARLKGSGNAAPLLLYGHVDVVTTENQQWTHPPFAGEIVDGFIWGRGALDMKGGVAMMVSAFLRVKAENITLPGDVILCIVCDEEVGGDAGANFMVQEHPEQFENVKYALGEFGGFTLYIGGKRFYPVMIAEKQVCWMQAVVRGAAGHGSMPVRGGAMAKLGRLLTTLDRKHTPVHITPAVKISIEAIADNVGGMTGTILRQLLNPMLTDRILKLLGARGNIFYPLLHNTVSPTILHGSTKINVIPAQASVELDARLLPGFTPQMFVAELQQMVGKDVEFEIGRYDAYPAQPNMGMYDLLKNTLETIDPTGKVIPTVLPAVTDGRFFAKIGIQTYGFLPMQLPQDFNFSATVHAADERIPVEAIAFGANAIFKVLQSFQ